MQVLYSRLQAEVPWNAVEAIGTLIAAAVALLIAVFSDSLRALHTRPRLKVSLDFSPPDCHKITIRYWFRKARSSAARKPQQGGDTSTATVHASSFGIPPEPAFVDARQEDVESYYFRLKIRNTGREKAESVEVFAARLLRRQADGSFKEVESFLPMNLTWAHYREVFLPAISPGTYKHCNLGHVIDPVKRVQIASVYPSWAEHIIWEDVHPKETILSLDTAVKPRTKSHLLPPGTYRLAITVAAANARPVKEQFEIRLTGDWYKDEDIMLGEGVVVRKL